MFKYPRELIIEGWPTGDQHHGRISGQQLVAKHPELILGERIPESLLGLVDLIGSKSEQAENMLGRPFRCMKPAVQLH